MVSTMTTPTTAELEALLAARTPGEWRVEWFDDNDWEIKSSDGEVAFVGGEENARLMALAPALAAEVLRLREENAFLVAENGDYENHIAARCEDIERLREAIEPLLASRPARVVRYGRVK